MLNLHLTSTDQRLRELLADPSNGRIFWIDNFQQTYVVDQARVGRDLWENTKWTAVGVKLPSADVDMSFVRDPVSHSPLPAMPDLKELFAPDGVREMVDRVSGLASDYFDDAAVVQQGINVWPLKLGNDGDGDDTGDDVDHLVAGASAEGVATFHPYDILGYDPSSREGLLAAFASLQETEGFGDRHSTQYSALVVDITIYWSLIKVLYSYAGCASIRRDLFLNLGLWHPYQHAYQCVWQFLFSTWLGPLWHAFTPGSRLFKKPKLRHLGVLFLWIRLATPRLIDRVRDTWDRVSRKPYTTVRDAHLRALRNLEILLLYIIPVVTPYLLSLNVFILSPSVDTCRLFILTSSYYVRFSYLCSCMFIFTHLCARLMYDLCDVVGGTKIKGSVFYIVCLQIFRTLFSSVILILRTLTEPLLAPIKIRKIVHPVIGLVRHQN